jgi:hypothetical protein
MKVGAQPGFEASRYDDVVPPVRLDLMRLAWERFLAGLKSPAPTPERRFMRADSRMRYAVRHDQGNGLFYLVRCHAFLSLLIELGDTGLGEWQDPTEVANLSGFHGAVFDAVAVVPVCGPRGRFGRIEFLAAVKKAAHEKYGAL